MTEIIDKEQCCTDLFFGEKDQDRALMGPAHAASAVGFFVFMFGFMPSVFYMFMGEEAIAIVLLTFSAVVAGVLIPDLDNSKSTVKSALGITGPPISAAFRESSRLIQTIVRTKRDESAPNPHRGFWHTILGSVLLGFIVFAIANIPFSFKLPIIGEVSLGSVLAFLIMAECLDIAISGLAKDFSKKYKGVPIVGELLNIALSFIVVGVLFAAMPENNFQWLGFGVALGCIIHIFGDALTKAGVPMFFPLPAFFKGKAWWNTRFAKFSADNEALNKIIYIGSMIAAVIGAFMFGFYLVNDSSVFELIFS